MIGWSSADVCILHPLVVSLCMRSLFCSGSPACWQSEKNTDRARFLISATKLPFTEIDVSLATNSAQKDYMHANSGAQNKAVLPQVTGHCRRHRALLGGLATKNARATLTCSCSAPLCVSLRSSSTACTRE